jgi:teichuronic acid exporter
MIGLIVTAQPLIKLLFTEKWASCVVFFQLMCAAGLFYPLHLINLNILKVKGRSDLFFRLELIKRSLSVVSILITYRWGISAMLTGQLVISIFAYFLNSHYSEKMIGYPVKTQILDVLPSLMISCLMGGGMLLMGCVGKSASHLVLLVMQIVIGMALYFLLHWKRRSEPLLEIMELIKRLPVIKDRKRSAL